LSSHSSPSRLFSIVKDRCGRIPIASRLADKDEVRAAKVFPYQLLVAWKTASEVPALIQNALQEAMEHSLENIPEIDGQVVICPDVSGSMQSAVTGHRKGATSTVRGVDVAAMISAALLRKNPLARIIPFEQDVRSIRLNPQDSVMTLPQQLASIGGGGTSCSAPLSLLNKEKAKVDAAIYVSDNESWVDAQGKSGYGGRRYLPSSVRSAAITFSRRLRWSGRTPRRAFSSAGSTVGPNASRASYASARCASDAQSSETSFGTASCRRPWATMRASRLSGASLCSFANMRTAAPR
jgi:hypothetical protein